MRELVAVATQSPIEIALAPFILLWRQIPTLRIGRRHHSERLAEAGCFELRQRIRQWNSAQINFDLGLR